MSAKSGRKCASTVERVFELLDDWRHLPAYKLEPRVDIFFALFLPEVLRKHFSLDTNPILIPEFPIKKSVSRQSIKVDYLALQISRSGKFAGKAVLVELKTDMASIRERQCFDMKEAASRGLHKMVCDVLDICKTTKEKAKYVHLLRKLSRLGVIDSAGEDVERKIESLLQYSSVNRCESDWRAKASQRGKEFRETLCELKVTKLLKNPSVDVIYVQPKCREGGCPAIDFMRFANFIERGEGNGAVRRLFACYLRQWAERDAGHP